MTTKAQNEVAELADVELTDALRQEATDARHLAEWQAEYRRRETEAA